MAYLNFIKSTNAAIVLADGSEIARTPEGGMSYQELAGMVGDLVRAIRFLRQTRAREHYNSPLGLLGNEAILAQVAAAKKPAKTKKVAKSEQEGDSESSASTSETASAAEPSSSASPSVGNAILEAANEMPVSHYQYATLGRSSVLDLSDDSDDDLLDDTVPTFKSG